MSHHLEQPRNNEKASVWDIFNSISSAVQGRDVRNFKGKDIIRPAYSEMFASIDI